MTFAEAFNTRAEEIGVGIRIDDFTPSDNASARVLKLTKEGQPLPQVGLVHQHGTLAVICNMDSATVCDGLVVYAIGIDAAFDLHDATWRNGILRRLHLFDGGIATGRRQTQSRGTTFAVAVHRPAKGLMQMEAIGIPSHE